ncbi:capsule polysaccharide export protein [alpha proteobacterium U9-1i]|nr:capsule polysaccharide export protein [alpha proteobacterium U9-1i]
MASPIWHTRRALLGFLAAGVSAAAVSGCVTNEAITPTEIPEYRLGAGDELRVIVFGEAELTGPFVVGTQGSIAYPLIGEVQAAGLTPLELAARLREGLSQFLRNPNVSVEVANYRPFFILGEVTRPGSYPYSPNLTVQNAVATAGGFTYRANRNRVYIKHANEAQERPYDLTSGLPVLPGDTLRIGERLF